MGTLFIIGVSYLRSIRRSLHCLSSRSCWSLSSTKSMLHISFQKAVDDCAWSRAQICNKQHFHLSKFEVEHKYFHQNLKWVLNFILDNMISKVISPKQKGFILTLSWQLTSQILKLMFLTFGGVWGSPREAFESPGSDTHHYLWHVTEYEDTFSSKKTNIQS